jgi:hypothetical protein
VRPRMSLEERSRRMDGGSWESSRSRRHSIQPICRPLRLLWSLPHALLHCTTPQTPQLVLGPSSRFGSLPRFNPIPPGPLLQPSLIGLLPRRPILPPFWLSRSGDPAALGRPARTTCTSSARSPFVGHSSGGSTLPLCPPLATNLPVPSRSAVSNHTTPLQASPSPPGRSTPFVHAGAQIGPLDPSFATRTPSGPRSAPVPYSRELLSSRLSLPS